MKVRANGLDFDCVEAGAGPLVLALHGFPDLPRTFSHQIDALAGAGYRVVAPHMRGYHPTPAPPGASCERAALAQDALALLDALTDRPAVVLGHDWGAAAAYNAATAAPARISKLVTIAVPYGETWWGSFFTNPAQQRRSWYMFFFQLPFAEAAVAHDDFALLEGLWRDWSPGWDFPAADLEAVKEAFRRPEALTAALDYYRHTFDPPDDPSLDPIRATAGEPVPVPTLYVHGERDGGIGVENVAGMEDWFPAGLELHVVPGAGHFVHRERPDDVNRLILDFLRARAAT